MTGQEDGSDKVQIKACGHDAPPLTGQDGLLPYDDDGWPNTAWVMPPREPFRHVDLRMSGNARFNEDFTYEPVPPARWWVHVWYAIRHPRHWRRPKWKVAP